MADSYRVAGVTAERAAPLGPGRGPGAAGPGEG